MPIEKILRKVTTTILVIASLAVGCWVAARASSEPPATPPVHQVGR